MGRHLLNKAIADFSDLTRKAAEALAELEAVKKAAAEVGVAELAAGPKIIAARQADIKALRDTAAAMDVLSSRADLYNQRVSWRGASNETQYLANLQREEQYTRLLNIQKQRGFYSPYQDYAFRNQEIAQMYLFQRSSQGGYATPDQYLAYLSSLRHAMEMENQAWRDRVNVLSAATAASVANANGPGLRLSADQFMTASAAAQSALAGLNKAEATVAIEADDSRFRGAVSLDQSILGTLGKMVATPKVQMDNNLIMSGLAAVQAALAKLEATKISIGLSARVANVVGPTSPLTGGSNAGAGPPDSSAAAYAAQAAMAQAAAGAVSNLTAAQARDVPVAKAAADANDGLARSWAAGATAGTGFGMKIAAAGGILGSIALWHFALDGVIEAIAILVPALTTMVAGLGIWGAAAYQSGKQVYQQFQNINTVSTALNQNIPPMTGAFKALQDAVRPQVFELAGIGILGMQKNTGVLSKLATDTGQVLDRFAARVLLAFQNGGKGLQTFISVGEHMLAGLGVIVANISHLFTGLIAATTHTHIAEDMLAVLVVASKLVGVVANLIHTPVGGWIAAVALGLHGMWVWGGAALTGLQALGIQVARMTQNIPGMTGVSLGFARSMGATNDQLAAMGAKTPALERIAQGIIAGDANMVTFAKDTGISDQNLVKLVARQPEIKRLADSMGQTADAVAGVAIGMAKSGRNTDEFAAKMAGGADKLSAMRTAAKDVGSNIVNIAAAAGGSVGNMSKLGTAAEDVATGAAKSSRWMGLLNGAVQIGTRFWPVLAAAAVAGIGVLIYHLATAKDATQQWFDTMQQGMQNASSPNAGWNQMVSGLDQLHAKLVASQAAMDQAAGAAGKANVQFVQQHYDMAQVSLGFDLYHGKLMQAAGQNAELTNDMKLQQQQFNSATQFIGQLSKSYGTDLVGSLNLATLAGVKFSDMMAGPQTKQFQAALLQVAGLVQGYQTMGQQSGIVGQDMNALAVAAGDQLASMQKLNQAWDTFISLVGAPVTSFLAWDQAMITFQQNALQAGSSMTGLGQNMVTAAGQAAKTTPTITNAAVQLQQQFQSVFTSSTQMFNAFRNAQAVNGGAGNFIQFAKDVVAALIPFAGHSQAALAEISALAQEAGGPAVNGFSNASDMIKALVGWTGKIKDPMLAAYNATQKMTVATSNLSLDAQQLANSLQSDMTSLIKNSVEMAYITPLMNAAVQAISKWGAGSSQATDAVAKLNTAVAQVTGSQQEANTVTGLLTGSVSGNMFVVAKAKDAYQQLQQIFAKSHAPAGQLKDDLNNITTAALLYGRNSPQYQAALDQAINDTVALGVQTGQASQLINDAASKTLPKSVTALATWAKNGLGLGAQAAGTLAAQIQLQLGGSLNNMGNLTLPKNATAFQNWAKNALNLSQTQAYDLWQQMITLQVEMGTISAKDIPSSITQFEQWAKLAMGDSVTAADNLWGTLINRLGPQLDAMGNLSLPKNEAAFISWAVNGLHLSQSKAHELWGELVTLQGQIDAMHGKNVSVGVGVSGSGSVSAKIGPVTGGLAKVQGGGSMSFFGAGGRTNGYAPNSDTVPAMLSPGEYVLTPEAAAGIGYANLDAANYAYSGRQPARYASGGAAGVGSRLAGPENWASSEGGSFAAQMGDSFASLAVNAFQAAAQAAANQAAAFSQAGLGNVTPGYSASVLAEQQYAASLFPAYGWSVPYEMPALIALWNQESGWNPYAANPLSNARGIPQNINGWSAYAPGDYKNQIIWGLNYIKNRQGYGDPLAAWAHEQAFNWYASGGAIPWGLGFEAGGSVPSGGMFGTNVAGNALVGAGPRGMPLGLAAGGPGGTINGGGITNKPPYGGPLNSSENWTRLLRNLWFWQTGTEHATSGLVRDVERSFTSYTHTGKGRHRQAHGHLHEPPWVRRALSELTSEESTERAVFDRLTSTLGANPGSANMKQFNQLQFALWGFQNRLGDPQLRGLRRHWAWPYDFLGHNLRQEQANLRFLEQDWQYLFGEAGQFRFPGQGRLPGTPHPPPTVHLPNPQGLPPGVYDFRRRMASGGSVGINQMLGQLSLVTPAASGIDAAPVIASVGSIQSAQPPRTQSAAAINAARGGAVGANVTFGDIIINNPRPEVASTSITRGAQRGGWMAGRELS